MLVFRWWHRVRNAWRRHGAAAFFRLGVYNVHLHLRRLGRGNDKCKAVDPFDEAHGTDTGEIREIGSLDVESPNARHAFRYQPSSQHLARCAIQALGIEPSEFTFIDLGSGKGRILLIAAEFPFKEIIGVEFSRELHNIALENISLTPSGRNPAARISCVCCDAVHYELPHSDLVCYMYNPFGPPVLSRIAERIIDHRKQHGFRTIVIYVDPCYGEVFDRMSEFRVIKRTSDVLVLTS